MVILVRDETLYMFQGKHVQYLVHNGENLCEFWHRWLGRLHYSSFPSLREIFIGLS
jgi:hypothetical protein